MAQFSDKALQGMIDGGAIAQEDAPRLARETLRLRREARAMTRCLKEHQLWDAYCTGRATAAGPAARPAGKQVGKPAGAAI